jgi:Ser/Thr protein kinase RdoA (MazF antagonist)
MDAVAVAERFDLGKAALLSQGPVARGKQGVVWRLTTSAGRWAVKVPFATSNEDEVRLATQFQETAYSAGVPTPEVRRTREGDVFATIGTTQVRVYEWVDLLPPDSGLDPALVGSAVAAIHQIALPAAGPPHPWYHEPVGADHWDQLVDRLVQAGAPFAGRLRDLRDELVALESWIEPPRSLQICHRDLWADNVLPTSAGGICIIDWENSGSADPNQELACLLFEFGRTDPGRVRSLLDAYQLAGGRSTVNRRGDFSMLIAELGHITAMAAADWLEPNQRSPSRADSVAWISEVFDEPHTRRVLDTLLHHATARS